MMKFGLRRNAIKKKSYKTSHVYLYWHRVQGRVDFCSGSDHVLYESGLKTSGHKQERVWSAEFWLVSCSAQTDLTIKLGVIDSLFRDLSPLSSGFDFELKAAPHLQYQWGNNTKLRNICLFQNTVWS